MPLNKETNKWKGCWNEKYQFEAPCMSNHTEVLWYNETVSLWMTIYTISYRGLSNLAKELSAVTRVMQSSFNELSTLVSDSKKCKQTELIQNTL